jgi:hypothetical protein
VTSLTSSWAATWINFVDLRQRTGCSTSSSKSAQGSRTGEQ